MNMMYDNEFLAISSLLWWKKGLDYRKGCMTTRSKIVINTLIRIRGGRVGLSERVFEKQVNNNNNNNNNFVPRIAAYVCTATVVVFFTVLQMLH